MNLNKKNRFLWDHETEINIFHVHLLETFRFDILIIQLKCENVCDDFVRSEIDIEISF